MIGIPCWAGQAIGDEEQPHRPKAPGHVFESSSLYRTPMTLGPANRLKQLISAAGLLLLATVLAGCQGSSYAVSTLERDSNERATRLVLTDAEQAEALAAMKSVAVDHTPSFNRNRLTHGMRWSDVPNAVIAACDEEGVEMVVLHEEEMPWGIRFHMRTADDRPATLDVTRTRDERIYTASATVGRFDTSRDRERAALLIEQLDHFMARYGEKRRLHEDADE